MSAAVVATSILMATPALVEAGIKVYDTVRREQNARRTPPSTREGKRTTDVDASLPSFTSSQLKAMAIIAKEVKQASLPPALAHSRPALIMGLWVNAWYESRLNPTAYNGKGESSVGLFQINQRAHRGHSREDLQDGAYNTRVMLGLIRGQAKQYEPLLKKGATVHTLAAAITLWTERPKDKKKKAIQRAKTLARWFPSYAYQRAIGWTP